MTIRTQTFSMLMSAALLAGCQNGGETAQVGELPAAATGASVEVAGALRDLDLGRDTGSAIASLEQALASGELSDADHDRVVLGLSRAFAKQGNKEKAITLLESRMAERKGAGEDFDEALFELVTGQKRPDSHRLDEHEPVAAFARTIAPSFSPGPDGKYELSILLFGGEKGTSDQLGTYNIGRAIRELRRESCSVCTDSFNIHTSQSRKGDWTGIPSYRQDMPQSLVVFYVDSEKPVPARYDDLVPLKASEVQSYLDEGVGVIAVSTPAGSPPRVLMAAPRAAQLAQVEEKLAALKELPETPIRVTLQPGLTRGEIQAGVRSQRKALKDCYEALLSRAPGATGKAVVSFEIDADGKAADVAIDAGHVGDTAFASCMQSGLSKLTFPATGQKTTVRYPFTFSPD